MEADTGITSRTVREITGKDIPLIVRYWSAAEPEYLKGMGVDLSKMPASDAIGIMLRQQLDLPVADRSSYCMIWLLNGYPVGHSNINKINPGTDASMHLHLWKSENRNAGHGSAFVKLTIPFFFSKYNLQLLYSEPFALNPAPHKSLLKAGFTLEKEYITVPGSINFEQRVKRWILTVDQYMEKYPPL